MSIPRVGIIGLGQSGRKQALPVLMKLQQERILKVTAGFTRNEARREAYEGMPVAIPEGMRLYYGSQMPDFMNQVDVVHICSTSSAHPELITMAANCGKLIIVDKPIGVTLQAIDDALEAVERKGVRLGVNFQQRFHPHAQRLHELIQDGTLDEIKVVRADALLYRPPSYFKPGGWKGTLQYDGGGALMNQGIHVVDLAQWLMASPVARIEHGQAQRLFHRSKEADSEHGIEVEDFAYGDFTLESGAKMYITGSTAFNPDGFKERVVIGGYREGDLVQMVGGVVESANWNRRNLLSKFPPLDSESGKTQTRGADIGLGNHERYFRRVYNALAKGEKLPISGEDGRKAVEIILGVYLASQYIKKTGASQPINFPIDVSLKPVDYVIDYRPKNKTEG